MRRLSVNVLMLALCGFWLAGGPKALAQDGETKKPEPTEVKPDDTKPTQADYDKVLEEARIIMEVKRQAQARIAESFYTTGKKNFDARLYEDSERDLVRALAANPNHEQAKELLTTVRRINRKTVTGEVDTLESTVMMKEVDKRRQLADMTRTMVDARQLLRDGKFDDALGKLDVAQNTARTLAMWMDMSREQAEIKSMIETAKDTKKKTGDKDAQEKLDAAAAIQRAELERKQGFQKQRVTRLMEDAQQLANEKRYLVAAKKVDEILKIEPLNKEASAFRDRCLLMQKGEEIAWYQKTQKEETDATWRTIRKEAIPFSQVQPLYPDDWAEKRLRTQGTSGETESAEELAWKKPLTDKLDETVTFDFIATPLDDVVAFFRQLKRVNIVVDKAAVVDLGPLDVTLRLENTKFKDALEWVLRLINLKYTLEDGAIFISTAAKIGASKKVVTRFYDVTDLTVELKNFKPNVLALSNTDILADQGGQQADIFQEQAKAEEKSADAFTGESLVEFIKSVIAPGTWEDVNVIKP